MYKYLQAGGATIPGYGNEPDKHAIRRSRPGSICRSLEVAKDIQLDPCRDSGEIQTLVIRLVRRLTLGCFLGTHGYSGGLVTFQTVGMMARPHDPEGVGETVASRPGSVKQGLWGDPDDRRRAAGRQRLC